MIIDSLRVAGSHLDVDTDLTPDLTSPILTYLEAGYTPKPGTRRLPLDAWQANRITG